MADETLNIWLHERVVATLRKTRSDVRLEYEADEIRRAGTGAVVLSASLLTQHKAYGGNAVLYWLEGLLPEGEARTTLESMFDVRRGDAFGLLRHIGRECAGAVAFLPVDERPAMPGQPTPLSDAELEEAIRNLPTHPLGVTPESGISLGGLQSKLLVCKTEEGWALPTNGAPSTHILKPAPFQHPELARAEEYAMRIARDAGLVAAAVDVIEVSERDVLVVERFDREIVDGVAHRLHQEDACQALGIDSRDRHKYQQRNGGPSYGQIAKFLVTHAVDRDKELRALAEAMVLTCAIGNTDAHGKNHSFLIDGDTLCFAPIYDASPTVSFVTGRQLAMYVGGSITIGEVNRMQLALEAKSWGLSRDVAIDIVDDALLRLGRAIEEADVSGVLKAVTDDVKLYSSRLLATRSLQVEQRTGEAIT